MSHAFAVRRLSAGLLIASVLGLGAAAPAQADAPQSKGRKTSAALTKARKATKVTSKERTERVTFELKGRKNT